MVRLDRIEKSRDEWRTIAGKFRAVFDAGSGAREDLACEEYDRMIKTMNPTNTTEQAQAKHEAELASTLDDLRPYSAAKIEELKRTTLHGPPALFRLITTVADLYKQLAAVRAERDELIRAFDKAGAAIGTIGTIGDWLATPREDLLANAITEVEKERDKFKGWLETETRNRDEFEKLTDRLTSAKFENVELLAIVRALAEALGKSIPYLPPREQVPDCFKRIDPALIDAAPYLAKP